MPYALGAPMTSLLALLALLVAVPAVTAVPGPTAVVTPDYSWDPRTGLCFASRVPHGFTLVPCTDEVMALADPKAHGG